MTADTKFFPSFHRRLFGRPPVSKRSLLERKAREADRLCLTQLHTLFEDVLPPWLVSYKSEEGANSRHRIYTPLEKDARHYGNTIRRRENGPVWNGTELRRL